MTYAKSHAIKKHINITPVEKKKLTPKIEKRLRKFIGEINEISESITVSEILPNRKILKKKLGRLVNYKYVYKLPKH